MSISYPAIPPGGLSASQMECDDDDTRAQQTQNKDIDSSLCKKKKERSRINKQGTINISLHGI